MLKNKLCLILLLLAGMSLTASESGDREKKLAEIHHNFEKIKFLIYVKESPVAREVIDELITEKSSEVLCGALSIMGAGYVGKKAFNFLRNPALYRAQRFTDKKLKELAKNGCFQYPVGIRSEVFAHRDRLLHKDSELKNPAVMTQILKLEHLAANTAPIARDFQEQRLNSFLSASSEQLK